MRLDLVEPRPQPGEPVGAQPKHAEAGVRGHPLVNHHARFEEQPEVAAHHRGRYADRLSELAGPVRADAEQFDHLPPGGIGDSREQEVSHHLNNY